MLFAIATVVGVLIQSVSAAAQERAFELSAPAILADSGLLKFIVPRFSLKSSTRVEIVADGAGAVARLNLDGEGLAVFSGPEGDWYLDVTDGAGAEAANRFADWLTGDVGRNTIAAFAVDGDQPYRPAAAAANAETSAEISGDVALGEDLAELHCGRCHMVNEKTRMTTIGSTPSFALMRGFGNWSARFESFYESRPHPAFTIVEEVTAPFDETSPPPIAPVRITLDEIAAILAYVAVIKPADLGGPIDPQ